MNLFKSVKTPILIGCIAAAVIGLLLLIWPVFILKFICILLAVALIAVGCLRVMTYFKETKKVGLPALNLAIGLFLIVSGIAVIAESSQIIFLETAQDKPVRIQLHKMRTGSQGEATASETSEETDSPATEIDLAASAPRLSLYASAGRLFSGER